MDEKMVIKEIIKTRLVLIGLFLCSAAIMIFCVIGVYDAFWNVPAKRAAIAELTDQRNTWQCRVNELERYIDEREEQYKLATRWSKFHEMMCDTDQKIRFDMLENYVVKKRGLYKTNGEINRLNK